MIKIDLAMKKVRFRAMHFVRRRYPNHANKRLQAELGLSSATAERVLAGDVSRSVLDRMLAAWGWEFANYVLEPLCGALNPSGIDVHLQKTKELALQTLREIEKIESETAGRIPRIIHQTGHENSPNDAPRRISKLSDGLLDYATLELDKLPTVLRPYAARWEAEPDDAVAIASSAPDGNLFAVADNVQYLRIADGMPYQATERLGLIGQPVNLAALPADFIAVTVSAAKRVLASGQSELHRLHVRMRDAEFAYHRLVLPGQKHVAIITDYGSHDPERKKPTTQ